MSSYEKVDKEIAKNRLWRAKEILQGRLASQKNYDAELFEKYGQVLLAMKDSLEAGKYLFLSGVRKPEYQEAISLFFSRYGKKEIGALLHVLPHSAQTAEHSSYPKSVIVELKDAGYKPKEVKQRLDKSTNHWDTFKAKIIGFLFLCGFIALFIGFIFQGIKGATALFLWSFGG